MKLEDIRATQRITDCGAKDLIFVAAGVAQTPPKTITGEEFLDSTISQLPTFDGTLEQVEVLIDSVGDGIGRTGFDVDVTGPLLEVQSGDQLIARVSQGGSFQFDLPFGGTINDRPYWGDLGDITLLQWTGTEWVYFDDGATIFSSDDDVATPDLVTTWSGGYDVELIPATAQLVVDEIIAQANSEGVLVTATVVGDPNAPIQAQNMTPLVPKNDGTSTSDAKIGDDIEVLAATVLPSGSLLIANGAVTVKA